MKARKQKERDIVELEERLESLRASSVKVDAKVAKSECVRHYRVWLTDTRSQRQSHTCSRRAWTQDTHTPTKRHAASVIT